jgi:DNA-directed RNA polymerase specialized sigma24 family protein
VNQLPNGGELGGTSEQINSAWDNLLEKYTPVELERRMSKMESYRKYYKSNPYDGTTSFLSLDEADGIEYGDNLLAGIMSDEAIDNLMSGLTEKQRVVVELSVQGYKPKEIAALKGQTSNNWRWHKSAAKKKLASVR